jgi:hypothetical protein
MVSQVNLIPKMSRSRQKQSRLRRVFQFLTLVEPELSVEPDSQIVAGRAPRSRSRRPDRTRVGSAVGGHEPSRAPSPSHSSLGRAGSTHSQKRQNGYHSNGAGTRTNGGKVIVMSHNKKIALPQVKVLEVSKTVFYGYWATLASACITIGLIWGF